MARALRFTLLLGAGFLMWLLAVWPPPSWYRTHWPRSTAFMARPLPASRGADPGPVHPVRRYRPVPLDSIAPTLADAVIIGEDNRYFLHHGIDYVALAQALGYPRATIEWSNPRDRHELVAVLPHAWRDRNRLRGASTITQQLAKNLYLSPSRNPLRKLKEAVIAWRLEAALGKRRIMELYLNVVELGRDVYGVEAASELYYGRTAAELSAEQAAALAGALPFPLRSNPGYRPGRMQWRQQLILRRLRGDSVVVPDVIDEETAEPVPADSSGGDSSVVGDSGWGDSATGGSPTTEGTDSMTPAVAPVDSAIAPAAP
jgi:monofunctional biosynthetic peptidoglycan transglycosylase